MDIIDACMHKVWPLINAHDMAQRAAELAAIEQMADFDSFEAAARHISEAYRTKDQTGRGVAGRTSPPRAAPTAL